MKNIIVILFLLLNINLFSQEYDQAKMFSTFKVGVLAGMNFSTYSGGSILIEGKTNLTSNLNLKLSLGYSTIIKKEGIYVQTYDYFNINNEDFYQTSAYTIDKLNYDVFPVSLGFEYFIQHDVFSPYVLVEGGYNFFSYHQEVTYDVYAQGRQYHSFNQLPAAFQAAAPLISKSESYRLAIGAGTTYKLSRFINLDLRYVYQYNSSLESTNQIMVGINL
jgi:hypothetical protein